jgi:hypothetical protein
MKMNKMTDHCKPNGGEMWGTGTNTIGPASNPGPALGSSVLVVAEDEAILKRRTETASRFASKVAIYSAQTNQLN